MTPTPKPQPSPSGPLTEQQLIDSLSSQIGGSGSSSGSSKYGLGEWGSTQINPGDLPIFGTLIGSGKATTGDNIVHAFASASPVQLAEIQRALFLGGFYSHTYTPSYGVISPEDITAFGHAVTLAGQQGGSVSDLLLTRAKYGTSAGVAAAQASMSKAALKPKAVAISVPAAGDLEAQAMNAFEQTLGRKAKPKEAAAFASAYQAMSAGVQRANALAEQQAVTGMSGAGGGLTTKQEQDFQGQLGQVGQPADVPALPRGLVDNPAERALAGPGGVNGAMVDHQVPIGFGEQLAQLQTLGQAVTAAAAQKNPALNGGGGISFVDEQQPEDASVAAANFARSTHPKAAARNDLAGALDTFLSLLGSRLGA